MKILYFSLICFLLVMQFQLWFGDDGIRTLNLVEEELAQQKNINAKLEDRNRLLEIEVVDLKTGVEAIEERARSELGMIKEGETFFLIVD
jgi:cell division protein FtsB